LILVGDYWDAFHDQIGHFGGSFSTLSQRLDGILHIGQSLVMDHSFGFGISDTILQLSFYLQTNRGDVLAQIINSGVEFAVQALHQPL
jgi:hypothetical protein